MRKVIPSIFMVYLILTGLLVIASVTARAQPTEKIPVIVGFKDKPDVDVIQAHDGDIKHVYNIIPAISCSLPEKAIDALKTIPKIMYIEPDGIVQAIGEVLPWGVDRIDAELVHPYNKGTGVKISIIDTGIDYNHPDLDANIAGGKSFVAYTTDYMDDNGHGTHVAGIIAAEDNEIGVIGVAPEAKLYALKTLDSEGSGYISDIVAAIDWSVTNGMQIISMSIGTNTDYTSLRTACNNAYAKGLLLIAAAGNDATTLSVLFGWNTIDYPARYGSVIAVGATGSDDKRASWSSTGPELELVAPGVDIYSTYLGGRYTTLDGTSMACPHVTGTAALVFKTTVSPTYDLDKDEIWDAAEVRKKLQDTADDLGNPGRDPLYGYGLVDADEAAPEADATPPSTITDLTATAGAYPDIDLAWTAATDNVGVNHYDIYRSTTGTIETATDLLAMAPGTASSYKDSTGIAETTYYYVVCAVDAAGNEAGLSNIASATVAAAPSNTMHVGSIDMSKQTIGRGRWSWIRAVAIVTVVDADGNPVEGATVYGHWSGLTSGDVFGTTDANGRVTSKSRYIRSANGTFTFTVDNAIKEGWTYDPSANEETSDSITVQPGRP